MDPIAAKYIGAGIACLGMAGAGIGLGNLFGQFLAGALRNPSAADGQRGTLLLGFALTEALGIEWAKRGVRVVGIAPGVILTDMVRQTVEEGQGDLAAWERRTPMRRLGTVDEIAEAALFLSSAEASYIVGETLRVDGGWTAYQLF